MSIRANDTYNLEVCYPEVASQWDYGKNGDVKPIDVTPHSNIKRWWRCEHGHIWDDSPSHRVRYRYGCPYCSNHRACLDNCLATKYPDIARQWHPTKNGDVTPYDTLPNCSKRCWWQCEKGHEWYVTPNNRMTTGCPYCSGRKASSDHCVASEYPWMVDEWHPTKNGKLTPYNVTPSSGRKIWFVCPLGHEWRDTVPHRVNDGRGCSVCNRGTQTSFPEQAIYYYIKQVFDDAINRHKLIIDGKGVEADIYVPSLKLCIEYDGYVHKSVECDVKKTECMLSDGLFVIRVRECNTPHLACNSACVIQRCDDSFGDLKKCIVLMFDCIVIRYGVSCKCDVDLKRDCYRIYSERYTQQKENNFGYLYPELLSEWDYERNDPLNPFALKPSSNIEVWWQCSNGHSWSARLPCRTLQKQGCPYCSGRRLSYDHTLECLSPELCAEWHPTKNKISPDKISAHSCKKVWWRCENGHEWETAVRNRYRLHAGCPYCSGRLATPENNFADKFPCLMNEWNWNRNVNVNPHEVTPFSQQKVWWKCESCGHEWCAQVCNRANGTGCPNYRKHADFNAARNISNASDGVRVV